jgi:hypothetical protein
VLLLCWRRGQTNKTQFIIYIFYFTSDFTLSLMFYFVSLILLYLCCMCGVGDSFVSNFTEICAIAPGQLEEVLPWGRWLCSIKRVQSSVVRSVSLFLLFHLLRVCCVYELCDNWATGGPLVVNLKMVAVMANVSRVGEAIVRWQLAVSLAWRNNWCVWWSRMGPKKQLVRGNTAARSTSLAIAVRVRFHRARNIQHKILLISAPMEMGTRSISAPTGMGTRLIYFTTKTRVNEPVPLVAISYVDNEPIWKNKCPELLLKYEQNERDASVWIAVVDGGKSLLVIVFNLNLTVYHCNTALCLPRTSCVFVVGWDTCCHSARGHPTARCVGEPIYHELAFHTASPGHRPSCRVVIYVGVYVVFYYILVYCIHNLYVLSKLTIFCCICFDCVCARRAASDLKRVACPAAAEAVVVVAIINHGLASVF